MAKKTIYIVRHGETDYNKSGIVQGRRINASINEQGQLQRDSFFQAYKEVPFQKLYTSALKRTRESIQGFIDLGIPVESHDGLDEISWGDYDGTDLFQNEYYFDMIREWKSGNTHVRPVNGESPDDVVARQKPVMQHIVAQEEDLVLVCMHGRAIRILMCHLLECGMNKMDEFKHTNLGLYVLEYEDGVYKMIERNRTDHLIGWED